MSIENQFGGHQSGIKQSIEAEYDDGSDDVQGPEMGFATISDTTCCLPEK